MILAFFVLDVGFGRKQSCLKFTAFISGHKPTAGRLATHTTDAHALLTKCKYKYTLCTTHALHVASQRCNRTHFAICRLLQSDVGHTVHTGLHSREKERAGDCRADQCKCAIVRKSPRVGVHKRWLLLVCTQEVTSVHKSELASPALHESQSQADSQCTPHANERANKPFATLKYFQNIPKYFPMPTNPRQPPNIC